MRILGILVAICNVAMLCWLTYLIVTMPPKETEFLFVAALAALPLINLGFIALSIASNQSGKPSIVQLFWAVRRAKLEQQLAHLEDESVCPSGAAPQQERR